MTQPARSRSTLPALLAHWARVVDYVDREVMTADEFRADVAVRHEIAGRMRKQSFTPETREMLADLDSQFRAATLASDDCIHGADVAAREGWTPVREWYFWRVSAKRAGALGASAALSS
jgi:hypothetical protein